VRTGVGAGVRTGVGAGVGTGVEVVVEAAMISEARNSFV
jgi:hypothetical protein